MTRLTQRALLGVAALAILFGPASVAARADFDTSPNPPRSISYKQFIDSGFQPVNMGKTSKFTSGGNMPTTGTVISRVFQDPKTKLYAYLYQITVDNVDGNAGKQVNKFFMGRWRSAFATFTRGEVSAPVFQITERGMSNPDPGPFMLPNKGVVPYVEASGDDNAGLEGFFVNDKNKTGLRKGQVSGILVVFSTKAPKVDNNFGVGVKTGISTTFYYVDVYTPMGVPEPSSLVMLALGGAGLAGIGWRRQRQRVA
jgi:hypothetical protein